MTTEQSESIVINVAVKMSKVTNEEALNGLFDEIKFMCYLGHHTNIVSIIGAHTASLERGKLFLFTELCELGSLLQHLRQIKPANPIPPSISGQVEYVNPSISLANDLHKWAWGILNGMEYLASLKVR